jgi:hypothetical protein
MSKGAETMAKRSLGLGVCALAVASSTWGCIGSAPDLLSVNPDASDRGDSSLLEGGPGDATMGDETAVDDAGSMNDAAPGDGGEAGGAACVDGGNCSLGPCQFGTVVCGEDASTCSKTDTVKDGTSCDGGADGGFSVCSGGSCVACDQSADCSDPSTCAQKTIDCSTGSPVCTATGANLRDGTSCDTGKNCLAGTCTTCTDGMACPPANLCHEGKLSCATSTCVDQSTPAADGTPCASQTVCLSGQCNSACAAGGQCTPAGNICRTGKYICSTGVQTCMDMGAGQNVPCDDGNGCTQTDSCQNGTCTGGNPVSCTASDACHAAGSCTSTGSTTHTCSNPTGNQGGSCGTNMTCSSGTCGCASGFTTCGSSCVALNTDGLNCGTCGHGCLGGMCSGGHCQPTIIGTFSQAALSIVADSSYVYGTILGTGLVQRCPISGCSASGAATIATDTSNLEGSAFLNSTGLFFSDGSPSACIPANCQNGIKHYYAPAFQAEIDAVVADQQNVYWPIRDTSEESVGVEGIMTCPLSGCTGTPQLLVNTNESNWTDGLSLSGQTLAFTYAGFGSVYTLPTSGGTPNPIAAPPGSFQFGDPVTDSTHAVWSVFSETTPQTCALDACPLTGCPAGGPTAIVPAGSTCARGPLVIDSTGVYWVAGSTLQTCAAAGCGSSPTTLATGIGSPNTFVPTAVGPTAIFWVQGTSIWLLAK